MQILSEIQQIKNYAHTLKMTTMYDSIDGMLADATLQKWSPERLVCQLLKKEVNNRMEIRKLRRVKSASFPQKLYLDDLAARRRTIRGIHRTSKKQFAGGSCQNQRSDR